jgi:hypothetical protein
MKTNEQIPGFPRPADTSFESTAFERSEEDIENAKRWADELEL